MLLIDENYAYRNNHEFPAMRISPFNMEYESEPQTILSLLLIEALSCSRTNVQAAVAFASDGDTIIIPRRNKDEFLKYLNTYLENLK